MKKILTLCMALSAMLCSTVSQVSATATNAYSSHQVTDASGDKVAVWLATDDVEFSQIAQASTLIVGNSWATPFNVSVATDESLIAPPVVNIDSTGNILVAWASYVYADAIVEIRVSSIPAVSSGVWGTPSTPITVSSVDEDALEDFDLDFDSNDQPSITYTAYPSMGFSSVVRYTSSTAFDGNWTAPVTISDP